VKGTIWSYDIASAYPYAEYSLPCLACGRWRKTDYSPDAIGVVEFRVKASDPENYAWLPLPFRASDGRIYYPTDFRGWSWQQEFRIAHEMFPELVEPVSMWVYESACEHKPFEFLGETYRERVRWGKDGRGIVLKLGANASYGKTAQSIGDDPPFRELAWAGMTTATTRGQLLRAIGRAKNPWHVLSLATDGITSTERLTLEGPRDTGTFDLTKPLGVWEEKEIRGGLMLAKPGLYFRLRQPSMADIRARGIGRREVYENRDAIIRGFAKWLKNPKHVVEINSRRFFGARANVLGRSRCEPCHTSWAGVPEEACPECGLRGVFEAGETVGADGRAAYGRLSERPG